MKRTTFKPTVGQTLYRLNVGNNARHTPQVLVPVRVTRVGRKHFTVERTVDVYKMESEHEIDGWSHRNGGYSGLWKLYATEQEYRDECEFESLVVKFRRAFEYSSQPFTISQLRAAASALWPDQQQTVEGGK